MFFGMTFLFPKLITKMVYSFLVYNDYKEQSKLFCMDENSRIFK